MYKVSRRNSQWLLSQSSVRRLDFLRLAGEHASGSKYDLHQVATLESPGWFL